MNEIITALEGALRLLGAATRGAQGYVVDLEEVDAARTIVRARLHDLENATGEVEDIDRFLQVLYAGRLAAKPATVVRNPNICLPPAAERALLYSYHAALGNLVL